MAVLQQKIKAFLSGTHNLFPPEIIPKDAASDSLNWVTRDGHIELTYGRQIIGDAGASGKSYGEHTGFKADGTVVRFRKVDTKIQYFDGADWQDVITGLTKTADVTFSNYRSPAGSFVYIFGIDGIFKIATANPASYTSLYVEGTNYKGYGLIDIARTILWNQKNDPTGFYYSWFDNQRTVSGSTGVYTAVTGESVGAMGSTHYTGTLAFKASGATRTCFQVKIKANTAAGLETFTDDYNGVLTSDKGGTGTINYTTGAYDVTFHGTTTGAVTADYQWEDSNLRGVTDFRYSATRVAGEGNVLRQDLGGSKSLVVIPYDGSYFTFKENSCYVTQLDAETDIAKKNEIYRLNMGVKTLRSAVATSKGIVFIDTSNPTEPRLQRIQRNLTGDNFDVVPIFPQFSFKKYNFDDALIDVYDRYLIISCRETSKDNNRLLLGRMSDDRSMPSTVDVLYYGIRASARASGYFYGGDSVSQTTYELFTGFDDCGNIISNYWSGASDNLGSDALKKVKRYRYRGKITPQQNINVYLEFDNGSKELVGEIKGTGDYVNYGTTYAVGTSLVGENNVGGGDKINTYDYYLELRVKTPKFGRRKLRFEATGLGYVSIEEVTDFDIWVYQEKIPAKYRTKVTAPNEGIGAMAIGSTFIVK